MTDLAWTTASEKVVDRAEPCPCGSTKAQLFAEFRAATNAGGGAASIGIETRKRFMCLACGAAIIEAAC